MRKANPNLQRAARLVDAKAKVYHIGRQKVYGIYRQNRLPINRKKIIEKLFTKNGEIS